MTTRIALCLGLLALGGLCGSPIARGEPSRQLPYFQEEPIDALIRQLEPGLEFSVGLRGESDDAFAERCQVVNSGLHEVVATDPVTGLVVRRQSCWIPELRLLVLDTTVSNDGKQTVDIKSMLLADWDFRVLDDQDGARYRELTYRNDTWHGSTYWTGPDWTRVGKDWQHSGNSTPSVRRFRAPRDGRVNITGRVYKADTNNGGGDGVRLSIRHGGQTVWDAEIDGGDDRGVEPDVTLDIHEGDAIRFVVHKRGQISYDTTHWDPVVTYADGQHSQASEGFSTNRQGDSDWFYEMEVEPHAATGLPLVHGYGLNLDLREQTAVVGEPITLHERDALPLIVLADGADKSGVAMALTGDSAWQFQSRMSGDGKLHVELGVAGEKHRLVIEPGQSQTLPRLVLGAYRGSWLAGVRSLQAMIDSESVDESRGLRARVISVSQHSELDLWTMVQDDWRRQDQLVETVLSYADATQRQIEKTRLLLSDLRSEHDGDFFCGAGETTRRIGETSWRLDA